MCLLFGPAPVIGGPGGAACLVPELAPEREEPGGTPCLVIVLEPTPVGPETAAGLDLAPGCGGPV